MDQQVTKMSLGKFLSFSRGVRLSFLFLAWQIPRQICIGEKQDRKNDAVTERAQKERDKKGRNLDIRLVKKWKERKKKVKDDTMGVLERRQINIKEGEKWIAKN